jgi:DNA/RNA-binding domain of Phe-tRNA-synthetase-like protein
MICRFTHDPLLRARFPRLHVATLVVTDIDKIDLAALHPAPLEAVADARLSGATESELPEIRAWRAAYTEMGLKPTQYRCAAEALLRRRRLDGALPRVSPVVDFCNAVSAAFAIPLAMFDLDRVGGDLTVTFAEGVERFATFGGEVETPERGEVIFRDSAQVAHARRWVHRQSAGSAISSATARALMVAEAMHEKAEADLVRMVEVLSATFRGAGAAVEPNASWSGDATREPRT